MSYEDFKQALNLELSAARKEFDEWARRQDDYYRSQLALAYEDFSRLSTAHDKLIQERSSWRSASVALRSSWYFLVSVLVVGLVLGVTTGWLFTRDANARSARPEPTPTAAKPEPSAAQPSTSTASSAEPTSRSEVPQLQFVTRDCGEFAVQLASLGGTDSEDVLTRASILGKDLDYRLKFVKEKMRVMYSYGSDFCEGVDSPRLNNVFIWVGPFDTREDAARARLRLKTNGVSVDCFVREN